MKIIYDGTNKAAKEILDNIPPTCEGKWMIQNDDNILIGTNEGSKNVFIGDTVEINGKIVNIINSR